MSSCSIVYKDQSFATPQELIKYARKNNIREILDVVDKNIVASQGTTPAEGPQNLSDHVQVLQAEGLINKKQFFLKNNDGTKKVDNNWEYFGIPKLVTGVQSQPFMNDEAKFKAVEAYLASNNVVGIDLRVSLKGNYYVAVSKVPELNFVTPKDPQIREKYFPQSTVSADSILKRIADSNHPLAPIARKMLDYIPLNNVSVELFRASSLHPTQYASIPSGVYNKYTKKIQIAELANFKGKGSEPTLVHEIIHAQTVSFVQDNPTHYLVQDLNRLLEYARKNSAAIRDTYGLANNLEFISEFFTNATLIKDLQTIPQSGRINNYKNLWHEIYDWITNLFKFNREEKSLYSEAFPLMTNIFQAADDYNSAWQYGVEQSFDERDFLGSPAATFANARNITNTTQETTAKVNIDPYDPTKVKLDYFAKAVLEGDYATKTLDKNFTDSEISEVTINNVIDRLSKVFPGMNINWINPMDLDQADHHVPVESINSFVKGNTIFLVKGKFTADMKIDEMLHPFVFGLYTTNPELFDNLYDEAVKAGGKIEGFYKGEDARIETVVRALQNKLITNETHKSLWNQFISFLKRAFGALFPKVKTSASLSTDLTIQDMAHMLLDSGYKFENFYTDRPYYNSTIPEKQQRVFEKIRRNDTLAGVIKDDKGYTVKGVKMPRTTDLVQELANELYGHLPDKDRNKILEELQREDGTKLHSIIENIMDRNVDKNTGFRKASPDGDKNFQGLPESIYNTIEGNILDRLAQFSPQSRFIWEQVVFNPYAKIEGRKEKGLAGTIDLIVIDENSKVSVFDWKFISDTKMDQYRTGGKKQLYDKQLSLYTDIIKSITGLTDNDFKQIRIIPFIQVREWVSSTDSRLKSVMASPVVLTKETVKKLHPHVSVKEVIRDTKLTNYIAKLNKLAAIEAKKVNLEKGTDFKEDYALKDRIENAISDFLVLRNLDSLYEIHKEKLEEAELILKNIEAATGITDAEKTKYSDQAQNFDDLVRAIDGFEIVAQEVYGKKLEKSFVDTEEGKEKEKEIKANINTLLQNLRQLKQRQQDADLKIANDMAASVGKTDLSQVEKKLSGLQRYTTYLSEPLTRTASYFGYTIKNLYPIIENRIQKHFNDFKNLLSQVTKEQKQPMSDIMNTFLDIKDGKWNGKMKRRTDAKFYTDRDSLIALGSIEGIKAFHEKYYDMDEYRKYAQAQMDMKFKEIEKGDYTGMADDEIARRMTFFKDKVREKYDLNLRSAYPIMYQYKYLKIQSPEFIAAYGTEFYKNLVKPGNKSLLDTYNKILEINRKAAEKGAITFTQVETFVPNIDATLVESGGWMNPVQWWNRAKRRVEVDPSADLYGTTDPLTGKLEKRIYIPFTFDSYGGDYTKKSRDLFSSFSRFAAEVEKAAAMQDVQSFANLLERIEERKGVLPTNKTGKTLLQRKNRVAEIEPIDDDTNLNYYRDFVDWVIYGRRIKDSSDKTFSYTDKQGRKRTYSAMKIVNEFQAWQYLNTFGLNVMSPIRNYTSAIFGSYFMKGRHFQGTELTGFDAFIKTATSPWAKDDKNIALINYLNPWLDQEHDHQSKSLSMNKLTSWVSADNIMYLMRNSDKRIQLQIAYSLIQNMILVDGKVENVLTYLRRTKYQDMYNNPSEVKEKEREFKKDVEALKKSNGLSTKTSVVNGELKIDGLADVDQARSYINGIIQQYAKKASGSNNDWDTLGYKMTMLGRIVSPFRNWIIPTFQARTGVFKYNSLIEDYTWGRWNAYFSAVSQTWEDSKGKVLSTLLGLRSKEALTQYALAKFGQMRADAEQGKLLFTDMMSEAEFVNMYLQNINNTLNEFRVITALTITLMTGVLAASPGDDNTVKNLKKMGRLQLDRLSDDFSFYLSFSSFQDIAGNIIPLSTFIINFQKYLKEQFNEIAGFLFSEDMENKAHPTKYFMKSFPVTTEFTKWVPLLDPDLAREWGIQMQSSNTRH